MSWDVGLFDCFSDIKVCLISCFLGPCQLPFQFAGASSNPLNVIHFVPAIFCSLCCGVAVRIKIRERYGISGNVLTDALTVCCCFCCAVTQQTREVDQRGGKPSGLFMD
eukprot:TRINITY_DN3047_c0_g1_i1.p1 TRINITY_DN3047_c0_g1~~TRINITY_DN3047_c0_g1_i1.p1  ORF type:complete len:109 (+),score=26.23 TRINITY_DN3047_c0_g1_i1:70-396(+)